MSLAAGRKRAVGFGGSLQIVLRPRVLLCIRDAMSRCGFFRRPTLTDMVATSGDMERLQLVCVFDLQRANSTLCWCLDFGLMVSVVSPVFPLSG